MNLKIIEHQGKRYRVAVARSKSGLWVGHAGQVWLHQPEQRFGSSHKQETDVRAPMTGRIVKVEVQSGDQVEKNAVLVVMEAMKMEYRLTAAKNAVVEQICCKVGELVDLGKILVVFKTDE